MALQPVELAASNTRVGQPRVDAKRIRVHTLAAGTGLLPLLCAMARSIVTGFYQPWVAPVSEIDTITKSGTVSSGTFTITVDGQTSAAIAYNASNAVIQAALEAMPNIKPGDVVLSGGGVNGVQTGAVTLTWGGAFANKAFTVTVGSGSLVGGGSYVFAQSQAGVTISDGTEDIAGFLWPDVQTLNASGEVLAQIMTEGTVNYNDIPLNGNSQPNLNLALQTMNLRKLSLYIEGLAGAA